MEGRPHAFERRRPTKEGWRPTKEGIVLEPRITKLGKVCLLYWQRARAALVRSPCPSPAIHSPPAAANVECTYSQGSAKHALANVGREYSYIRLANEGASARDSATRAAARGWEKNACRRFASPVQGACHRRKVHAASAV